MVCMKRVGISELLYWLKTPLPVRDPSGSRTQDHSNAAKKSIETENQIPERKKA